MNWIVKIASGSIKEINNVLQTTKRDLWKGVEYHDYRQAMNMVELVATIEPLVEVDLFCGVLA